MPEYSAQENKFLNTQQQASLIAGSGLDSDAAKADSRLIDERRLGTLELNYQKLRNELLELDTHGNFVSKINQHRDKQINRMDKDIYHTRNNIMTLRRQTEIAENSFLKKDDILYILRTTFLYLTLIALIVMFLPTSQFFNFFIIVLTVAYVLYLAYNYFSFRSRDKNRWTVHVWGKPESKYMNDGDLGTDEGADDGCVDEGRNQRDNHYKILEIENEMNEIQKQIDTYDRKEKTRKTRMDAIQQKINNLRTANNISLVQS